MNKRKKKKAKLNLKPLIILIIITVVIFAVIKKIKNHNTSDNQESTINTRITNI